MLCQTIVKDDLKHKSRHPSAALVLSAAMQTAVKPPREDYYTRAANDDCIKGGSRTQNADAYDAAGNMVGDTTNTATYNDAGRLKTLTTGTATTTFIYNALGEMISAKGSTTTLYVYDQAGHLLGE